MNKDVEKEIWDQEVNKIKKERKKKTTNRLAIILLIIFIITGTVFGYYLTLRRPVSEISKLQQIEALLDERWFFADEYKEQNGSLEDAALRGMTTSEIDPFTTYMSSEELLDFQTSINKGFVGIGVQYIGTNDLNLITKVFKDSPAAKAGVKEGDVIFSVDDIPVKGKTSAEIADMVKGEKGSIVKIGLLREEEEIFLDIERDAVLNNTYGYAIDDDIAYVQLFSFGESTAYELEQYMREFVEGGQTKLIVDLRDNGGGYLDSLVDVAGLFLGPNEVCMLEEYSDGYTDEYKTKGNKIEGFDEYVILINRNSASASEVLTLALKEKLPNTTLVGETSYGKGTVQTTRMFNDGSALKFTVGKWMSPSGVWIHHEGIKPDVEILTPKILTLPYIRMNEGEEVHVDEVSIHVADIQMVLEFLNYDIDRTDGYFSEDTLKVLNEAQKDFDLTVTDCIDDSTYMSFISILQRKWATDIDYDNQLLGAIDLLK